MAETRRRILDTARSLFNQHGVHRVGVRDVARAAGISAGNLAYHFPTKDDLVRALVLELHELNASTVFARLPPAFSLETLYRSALAVMRNLLVYKFVLLSYVDAVKASPQLQELTVDDRRKRKQRHLGLVEALVKGGYLDRRAVARRIDHLFEQGELISSGWLNDAELQGLHDDEAVVLHYAKVGMALLEPHCTPKGNKQMRRILAGRLDEKRRAKRAR